MLTKLVWTASGSWVGSYSGGIKNLIKSPVNSKVYKAELRMSILFKNFRQFNQILAGGAHL